MQRKSASFCGLSFILCALFTYPTSAQETKKRPFDFVNSLTKNKGSTSTTQLADAALSQSEVIAGLKQALGNGVQKSIASLGKQDGFLKNMDVKIPVPPQLQRIEQGARLAGQGKTVDDFVVTLNRAGEVAVPEVGGIFNDAIQAMTIADATAIWKGSPNAATMYFRKVAESRLIDKIRPIVTSATEKVGVTNSYKQLTAKAAFASPFLKKEQQGVLDLDGYVTQKSLDGLFTVIAKEELNIRQNPTAQTTNLLKKMFGLAK